MSTKRKGSSPRRSSSITGLSPSSRTGRHFIASGPNYAGSRSDATPADRAAALDDIKLAIQHEKIDNSVLAVDHTSRGELLYEDERFDEALEESQLALKIAPGHVEAQVLQVRVLLKLRHYDEAISACDMAVQNGKKSAVLYELRGLAKSRNSDYSGAISDHRRALELSPNDANLLVHRGWSYLFFDSPKPALADFQAALSIDSKHGEAAGRPRHGPRGSATIARRWRMPLRPAASRSPKPGPRTMLHASMQPRLRSWLPTLARAEWGGCSSHGTPIWP